MVGERSGPLAQTFRRGNVKGCRAACRWGGVGWRGTARAASMQASFRAIHGGVRVIAFALPLPRFAAQTAGPVSPAPTPRRFAAAPDSGAPSTRRVNGACGSAEPCSAECFRQRPAALADHGSALPLFSFLLRGGRPRNLSGGRAGALSAMDAANEARRTQLLPVPEQPHRPAPAQLRLCSAPRGVHPFAYFSSADSTTMSSTYACDEASAGGLSILKRFTRSTLRMPASCVYPSMPS